MPRSHRVEEKLVAGAFAGEVAGRARPLAAKQLVPARLSVTLFVLMGATLIRPSTRLMASEGQSDSAGKPKQEAMLSPVAAKAADIPFEERDSQSEQILLGLANQARAQAGAPALKLDAGLCRAARAHAEAMLAAHQLSHQFEGERSLPQRLAAATSTQLDQEGENVAYDFDAENGHKHLMLSAPHRANLLNAGYNVIGLAVIRGDGRLYIVQDFGHALPTYSVAQIKERIAGTLAQARRQAKQADLSRRDLPEMDDAACSMASADKLGSAPISQLSQRYTVLTYTSLHPEVLPANAGQVVRAASLHSFAVGACYARTASYPTGVYWLVVALE
jgi:uncharacterized protein YkwD